MPAFDTRLRLAALLPLLVLSCTAQAQTHMTLSTPQGTCVFATDTAGIHLDPATGDLLASGSITGTCQTATGGTGTTVTAPRIVDSLTGDVPASTAAGSAVTLTWSADADNCTYSGTSLPTGASFANWATGGAACSSAAYCAGTHNVQLTPTVPGNYTFALSCARTGTTQTVTSQVSTTVPTATTVAGCTDPAGFTRQTRGSVFNYDTLPTRDNTDFTQYANLWGYVPATGALLPWPSTNGQLAELTIGARTYVSTEFTVPASYPLGKSGRFQFSGTNRGSGPANLSVTFSTHCGDFAPGTANPISAYCVMDNLPNTGDGLAILWSTYAPGTYAYEHSCHLTPGQKYYVNLMFAPLGAPDQPTCPSGSCSVTIDNGPGNF